MSGGTRRQVRMLGLGLAAALGVTALLVLAPSLPAHADAGARRGEVRRAAARQVAMPVNDDFRFRPVLAYAGTTVECPEDLDGSGAIDFGDILEILSRWGPCNECPQDLDGSGAVDFGDILVILSNWGPCP
jgi:hypothetical protein